MTMPPLPEAVHIRRNAHGFTHSFSHLQMDAYGRECAAEETRQLTAERDAYAKAADDMAASHKVERDELATTLAAIEIKVDALIAERDALQSAARLALDALERILYKDCGEPAFFEVRKAIAALKAVL